MNTQQTEHQILHVDFYETCPNELFLRIPKEQETWRRQVKAIAGRKWHSDLKQWSIPYCKDTVRHFHRLFKSVAKYHFEIKSDIPDHYVSPNKPKKQYFKKKEHIPKYDTERDKLIQQLTIKRYSPTTIKCYKTHFKAFLLYFDTIHPNTITSQQIFDYMEYLVKEKRIAKGTQNQVINAIKFYYEKILHQERKTYYLKHPKKSRSLPKVLSEEEVTRLINMTKNVKHKTMLMLMYSAGLRIGELVNLTIHDIRSDYNCILIKDSKGEKDRYTLLSAKLLIYLRNYYKMYRPSYWLFEGQYGGQYGKSSFQSVFKQAKIRAKVNPTATTHSLRHSFATHLVHRGMNLRYIQELLGHRSSKTTEIYTKIADKDLVKIQSPLDELKDLKL